MAAVRPTIRVTHLTNITGGHKGRQSFILVKEFDSRLYAVYNEPQPGQVHVAKVEAVEVPYELIPGPNSNLFAAAEAAEAQAEREAEEAAAAEVKELRRREGLAKAQAAAKAKRDAAKAEAARKAAADLHVAVEPEGVAE